ncbi:Tetratricopeptide-like helical domain,Tetratricopeptide, SHNi-TPR domain [Cinara cedri]|uniref:Tetratricopeptide-like helical domain,Tetratricopeptide, SHNi-TPR domain n=1 Tax=Cinara cedri TaxID=506608 RepID=A0A5E4MTU5_9HEMI|nr:Tetratricopeptide-like helical domain,Tetratricopeptide, SHNi-TPR domain [Cinara cedri]
MPSEVIQKENDISVDAKENIEQFDIKSMKNESNSQEIKIEDEVQLNDKSKVPDELSEQENKENQEPIIDDVEKQKKQADELLIDGKRNFIVKDFQAAATVLSEACSLFGTVYGEMAEECAEAYFMYGCALLELSKVEINPIGLEEKKDEHENDSTEEKSLTETNQINVINKETTFDGTNEVQEKSPEKVLTEMEEKQVELEEKLSEKEKKSDELENKVTEKEENPGNVEDELTNKVETNLNEEEMSADEEMSVDEEEKPDEEVEDDVNDLQLAWEMLDLAKVIYKNKDTEESKLKLAEVLMKCGEVSIEDEKFETAFEDMTESLQIRRLLLPEDSRIIAETLFQLGLAQELGGSSERAIELLTEATAVLNQRIKTLEELTDKNNETIEEMAEVKAVIPEIQEKIVDIKERKRAMMDALLTAVSANSAVKTNGSGIYNPRTIICCYYINLLLYSSYKLYIFFMFKIKIYIIFPLVYLPTSNLQQWPTQLRK